MKRGVAVAVDLLATLRAAIVENPRAVREERRLERTVIITALVWNFMLYIYIYMLVVVCYSIVFYEKSEIAIR